MSRQKFIIFVSSLVFMLLSQPGYAAADKLKTSPQEQEIEFLLTTIGSSGCLFIRNGSEHEPAEAESHLRMKYRKGRRYISDAEDFINRIASKSSWSGKPYQVKCPGEAAADSGPWLQAELNTFRADKTP